MRVLPLLEVERVLAEATWLVDVCRRELRTSSRRVSFARKPVLLNLLSCLAEAWPVRHARALDRARLRGAHAE